MSQHWTQREPGEPRWAYRLRIQVSFMALAGLRVPAPATIEEAS